MATIDPRQRKKKLEEEGRSLEDNAGGGRINEECDIIGVCVGFERFESSGKGTPGIMVRFVSVEGPHAGKVTDRNFWLSEKAVEQFIDLGLCFGYEEPWDPDDDDHVEKVLTDAPLKAVKVIIKGKEGLDGKTRYEPAFFRKLRSGGEELKDAWTKHIEAGEKSWDAYLKWRESNPRPAPGSAPQQTSGGGGRRQEDTGGGYGGGGGGEGGGGYADDDIPF